jgi:hypothetical protein
MGLFERRRCGSRVNRAGGSDPMPALKALYFLIFQ